MANEAVLYFETELPIPFICSESAGIERGTLVKMASPMTVSAAIVLNDICGGITAGEKIASDGKTKVEVYRHGIFKVTASGSITIGDPLVKSELTDNRVETSATNAETVWGIALETVTTGQTFLMELNPTVMQLA